MWPWGERRRAPAVARVAIVLAGALLVLAVPGHPAAAHAVLVGSDPPDGATLAQSPRAVELRFGEDISPRFSSARLVDYDGRPVAGTSTAVSGRGGTRRLVLQLPALRAGAYGVLWQALAETDGHTTRGVVVFNVGAGAGSQELAVPAGLGQPGARPVDVARRWVGLCLLAGLVGALAVVLALGLAGPRGDAAARQARRGGCSPSRPPARRWLPRPTSSTPPSRPPGRRRPPAAASGPRWPGSPPGPAGASSGWCARPPSSPSRSSWRGLPPQGVRGAQERGRHPGGGRPAGAER